MNTENVKSICAQYRDEAASHPAQIFQTLYMLTKDLDYRCLTSGEGLVAMQAAHEALLKIFAHRFEQAAMQVEWEALPEDAWAEIEKMRPR